MPGTVLLLAASPVGKERLGGPTTSAAASVTRRGPVNSAPHWRT
ncbi:MULTISPECIES: hypothetical protein [Streptomyces]|nr:MULTISPECIES: hypothetical protein [Streptomyces]